MNFLDFEFPENHQRAMRDRSDPIHRACDFYIPPSENNGLDIIALNRRLHSPEVWVPWPDFLVAFASYGCGDYYAYDLRSSPPRIVYIGAERTPAESLNDSEASSHGNFDEWYEAEIADYICPECERQEIRIEAAEDRQSLLRVCSNCGFREHWQDVDWS